MYLHPASESFPWAGDVLAARLVRLLNVLVGALTVVLTYATAVLIWPRNRAMAVGSVAFLAFSPMFLYMAGTINNDVIAALSGAAVMYVAVRLLLAPDGFAPPSANQTKAGLRWGVVMGAVYALALMSKFNLAPIALAQVLVLTYVAWQKGQWRAWFWSGVGMLGSTAVLAGWWFLRNQLIYGEPTGVETLTELWGVRYPFRKLLAGYPRVAECVEQFVGQVWLWADTVAGNFLHGRVVRHPAGGRRLALGGRACLAGTQNRRTRHGSAFAPVTGADFLCRAVQLHAD
jgi:4-amino-4-deoxy-L-arabinose transferase-like glycosyltransferase